MVVDKFLSCQHPMTSLVLVGDFRKECLAHHAAESTEPAK